MKTEIFCLAVLGLMSLSCAREVLSEENHLPAVPAVSEGMVIRAGCGDLTRTDISQGRSTWSAGDEITVFYDGEAYRYITAEGGADAIFTSEAGIVSYDASKSLTAWYPATAAEGRVSIPARQSLSFRDGTQETEARAPLAGVAEGVEDNVLRMAFHNVCSILELRVDAGAMDLRGRSLTLAPAPADGVEGYLSFSGTVDPVTLGIIPAESSQSRILDLPSGTDLTRSQTYKIPVGRLIAPAGLRLTLETEDGHFYTKDIFASGLTTYGYDGTRYTVKHFDKPLYAFSGSQEEKGIATASDLLAFAAAVNASDDLSPWTGNDGAVALLADLDLSGVSEWTPIGESVISYSGNTLTLSGTPFTGHFDGRGHSLHNLRMVCSNTTAGRPWGFFGALSAGALVENLTFAEDCSLTVSPSAQTDCGVLAGAVVDATVRNVENRAPMTYTAATAADNLRMTMGMVGLAYANGSGSEFDALVNRGALSVDRGNNNQNNANAVQTAGICGFASNEDGSSCVNRFSDCINYGSQNGNNGRASGLVASCNRYTVLMGCENRGNVINHSANARLGNVTCITGTGVRMDGVANYGDLVSSGAQPAGGCICLVNHDDNVFLRLANYGRVITDRTGSYFGTLFGQCNKAATFLSCIAAGDLGRYNGGMYAMTGVTADNYFSYVGTHSSAATGVTTDNITYSSSPAASPFPAKWVFRKSLDENDPVRYTTAWTNFQRIPASSGGGWIGVERSVAHTGVAFTCDMASNGVPQVKTLAEGDAWVFVLPGASLPAGSYVDFNATFVSYAKSAKYYILEVLDGGVWKTHDHLVPLPEDPSLSCSFVCSGVPTGDNYQHTTVMQTFRLDSPVEGTLKFRCRVVGNYACDGSALTTGSGGISRFAPFGYTACYIQNYGTQAPSDSKRVLFLGNSFFYYNNPVWVLKEIAFAEGLQLDIVGNFKGNQTFTGINSLSMTQEAIDRGGYDFAFFLGESYEEARYASAPSDNAHIPVQVKSLSDKIRAVSPACQVVLVSTWAYAGSDYEGYRSYDSFASYLSAGTASLAQQAGDIVSPVTRAFSIVQKGSSGINLYHSDNYHQGFYGAYLEACVHYLVISGRRFGTHPADCGLEPGKAAVLRAAAEAAVFN